MIWIRVRFIEFRINQVLPGRSSYNNSLRVGRTRAMANLELVAIGIFETDGVVSGAVFKAELRPFDVLRAGLANYFRGLVYGVAARGPERNPVSVRLVIGLLGEPEKVDSD